MADTGGILREACEGWPTPNRYTDALDKLVAERDRYREALAVLLLWQPITDDVFGSLHPQHQQAIRDGEAALGLTSEEGQ